MRVGRWRPERPPERGPDRGPRRGTERARRTAAAPGRLLSRVPGGLAAFFVGLGVYCAAIALILPLRRLLAPVTRFLDTVVVPLSDNLAYAVFLLLLAAAVGARKKVAWWLVIVYLGLLVLGDLLLVTAAEWEWLPNLLLCAVAISVLLLARRHFYAETRHGSVPRALLVLVLGLAAGVLAGWGLVTAFPGTLAGSQHLLWAANRVLGGLVSEGVFDGRPPHPVSFVLGLFGAVALLTAAATLFRSQRIESALHGDEEPRIRALLGAYGAQDSLGYFATRRDKAVVFSPNGRAAVTYRVETGVALASGDPVGDRAAWAPAIEAWLDLARRYAWAPAVMGASENGATAYARAGLGAIQLGDEAILLPDRFDLAGPEMRVIRQAVGRVRRTGATVRIRRHSALTRPEMDQIIDRADAWRDTDTERGFSMALDRLGDPGDGECLLVEARDAEGTLIALLSFVPWGLDGVSLDLMRRDRDAPNGVMEFMVAELCDQARSLGVRRISLNFAVFRAAFEEGARIGAGPVLRFWRRLLLFFSRWWQLEALYRSNVKYRPRWFPRFLCYGDAGSLARIALASGIAEGFVTVPGLRATRGRWRTRTRVAGPATTAGLPAIDTLRLPEPGTVTAARERRAPEQIRNRHRKAERLRAAGTDPYPVGVAPPTATLAGIRAAHPAPPAGSRTGERVTVAGRVMALRDFGGVVFAVLRDWSGDLQLVLARDTAGAASLRRFTADIDLGDQLTATGEIGASDLGELSVFVTEWRLTGLCLRPLPDKRHGLTDPEARVRLRALDLMVTPGARTVVRVRSTVVRALRQGLLDRGYLEVETPVLQRVHGGANARPFTTHSNAYDLDLTLRIAPELYLKRLCVGGLEKVFELGRTFRNEGVSAKHNPEFTMVEAYQAYADYDVMLDLARELIQGAATAAYGAPVARRKGPDGRTAEVDLSGRWPVRTVYGALSEALGEEIGAGTGEAALRRLCDRSGVPHTPDDTRGEVVLEMYERLVEERTGEPVFYKDFPADVSPLARGHRADPRLAERWDLVAYGTELGTAYSELTDPEEQRRRLTEQSLRAAGGDPEAMELDEDFLAALEYAMPPTGGLGLGVDRIVMFLTGLTIRETLPFPLVRGG